MASRHLTDLLDFQWKAEVAATELARQSVLHGPRHWRDVARIGKLLSIEEGIRDDLALGVFCFAAIHDSQRLSEVEDPDHGQRAAFSMDMIAPPNAIVAGELRERLRFALIYHDKGFTNRLEDDPPLHAGDVSITFRDKLVSVCWDADRLTIGRVGIEPEAEYMSTDAVRNCFPEFVQMANGVHLGDDLSWGDIAEMYV